MAIHRLRLIIATLAALLVPAALAGPALAAHIRVEGKSHSIFQGNARPFVGTLRGHTTTKQTALGSLVTASRRQPFALGLSWSDCCGGAWSGFFVSSIDHVHAAGHRLLGVQARPEAGRQRPRIDQGHARQPRAGLLHDLRPGDGRDPAHARHHRVDAASRPANGTVTFTVSSYDDAGTATPAAGAWVRVERRSPRRERQRHADAAVCPPARSRCGLSSRAPSARRSCGCTPHSHGRAGGDRSRLRAGRRQRPARAGGRSGERDPRLRQHAAGLGTRGTRAVGAGRAAPCRPTSAPATAAGSSNRSTACPATARPPTTGCTS